MSLRWVTTLQGRPCSALTRIPRLLPVKSKECANRCQKRRREKAKQTKRDGTGRKLLTLTEKSKNKFEVFAKMFHLSKHLNFTISPSLNPSRASVPCFWTKISQSNIEFCCSGKNASPKNMSWTSVSPFQCDQSHTVRQKLVSRIWLCQSLVCCYSLKESFFRTIKTMSFAPGAGFR
jgi:hypothetical protein